MARAEWLKQRETGTLAVPYFHVVFTLPAEIARLALQNKRLLYGTVVRGGQRNTLISTQVPPK